MIHQTSTIEIRSRPAGSSSTFTSWLAVGPLEELSALELAGEVVKTMRHLHPDREFALFVKGERVEE